MESCPFLEEANSLTGHLPSSDREEVRHVCAAVLSLYHDQIMPLFRRVRRRCAELGVGVKDLGVEGDSVFFSDLITRFPSVFVSEDPQSLCPKTGIFLIERPAWFHGWVCVHVARSSFPMVVWIELHSYIVEVIRRRARDAYRMKGGRYGMSWCLRNLTPSAVSLFSLGKLCHLIQFGIQVGMLKFKHDFLLPVATCPVGTEHDSSVSEFLPFNADLTTRSHCFFARAALLPARCPQKAARWRYVPLTTQMRVDVLVRLPRMKHSGTKGRSRLQFLGFPNCLTSY